MPRQARRLSESGIYHVMLRGVNRDAIFLEDADYERFLFCLARTKQASGCLVLAYCLMSNHVHLVLRASGEPIGAVVKRLGVRYSGWFNRKYGRVGHLFQDRFLSVPVEDDAYFVTLLRYVWANPVQAGLCAGPDDYWWSSRRLFGRASALVDGDELQRLLPEDPLVSLESAPLALELDSAKGLGPRRRHSDSEVDDLLERSCGARSLEDFGRLRAADQRRAICELRTRGVSYEQLARVTGLSRSSVRRVHVAGAVRSSSDAV